MHASHGECFGALFSILRCRVVGYAPGCHLRLAHCNPLSRIHGHDAVAANGILSVPRRCDEII